MTPATPDSAAGIREPGDRLAPGYLVLAHLHRGELLDVYDLWSEERACRCVGKAPRTDIASRDDARRALLREGRLLLHLSHPHIVRAYAVLTAPTPLVVLETLPGETLAALVARAGPLPAADLAYLGLHLCSALTYLHGQGWLHCDLTPDNIVSSHGLAKVLDLSLARRSGRNRDDLGTPGYRAPELAAGGTLSAATDSYGLGAVLAFALSGVTPGADEVSVALLVSGTEAERALRSAIAACLAAEPAARPSLADLAIALGRVIE
jgi:serine/threonine protein kinase